MKKFTIILIAIFSVIAMAAQKPCGEVFPNAGLKASLGVDGSRCAVSKLKKEGNLEITYKAMVSQDNSTIKLTSKGYYTANGEKIQQDMSIDCEDVGAGQIFECTVQVRAPMNGSETSRLNAVSLYNMGFNLFSKNDIYYLFGGSAPWEM